MGIALNVVGKSEVDNMGEVVNIKSSGCHIGGNEELGEVLAELLHGKVALLLTEVAVQTLGIISVVNKFVGNLLSLKFSAAEDNTEYLGVKIHNTLQGKIFVLGMHHIINMVDILRSLIAATHNNLLIFTQIALGNALYLATHCSREK